MTDKKDGGSAFPIWNPDMNLGETAGPGMSLRQWYAGMVLPEILRTAVDAGDASPKRLAKGAFTVADAMIEEEEHAK